MRLGPAASCRAVGTELLPLQRQVFVAIGLNNVRLDTLAAGLGFSGGAIWLMMFDVRRKLRTARAAKRPMVTALRGVHERLAGAG